MTAKKKIHSVKGLKIITDLSNEGKRIFSISDVQKISSENLLSVRKYLHYLTQEGWLSRIKPGVYSIQMPGAQSLHEFEIAMALVHPAAISHWSAMNYHGFTDQTSRQVYLTTTSTPPRHQAKNKDQIDGSRFPVFGVFYKIIKTHQERFFGHMNIWINDQKILITDRERTLIDGLLAPQHCGGFDEVVSVFQRSLHQIDLKKLINYSLKLDLVLPKRLGWILEHFQIKDDHLKRLEASSMPSIGLLNPLGLRKGKINQRWNLIENLSEKVG